MQNYSSLDFFFRFAVDEKKNNWWRKEKPTYKNCCNQAKLVVKASTPDIDLYIFAYRAWCFNLAFCHITSAAKATTYLSNMQDGAKEISSISYGTLRSLASAVIELFATTLLFNN